MVTRRMPNVDRGTSTLEMVIILPVLLFILFGIVELSRAFLAVNLATTGAREGARAGAVAAPLTPGADPGPVVTSDGEAAVTRILGAKGTGWTGSVTCGTSPCVSDSQVTAIVIVQFRSLFPILLPMLQSLTITQTAVSRYE